MAHATSRGAYGRLAGRLDRFPQGATPPAARASGRGVHRGGGRLHVLDYERASQVIETSEHMGVGVCYCRHKLEHVSRACDAPKGICMTFGGTADSLIRHGFARRADHVEGIELLQEAHAADLVQFGENVQNGAAFICDCCGCCCEAMIAARRFGRLDPVHTTNFLPHVAEELCNGCGKCVNACPVEAMTLVSASDPHTPKRRKATPDPDVCLGCGVCTRVCPTDGLRLEARARRVITPVDTLHRTVLTAIERNRPQDCVFDDRAPFSHRAMAAVLGVILRLPPLNQAMATEQTRSRYLVSIVDRVKLKRADRAGGSGREPQRAGVSPGSDRVLLAAPEDVHHVAEQATTSAVLRLLVARGIARGRLIVRGAGRGTRRRGARRRGTWYRLAGCIDELARSLGRDEAIDLAAVQEDPPAFRALVDDHAAPLV